MQVLLPALSFYVVLHAVAQLRLEALRREELRAYARRMQSLALKRRRWRGSGESGSTNDSARSTARVHDDREVWSVSEAVCIVEGASCLLIGVNLALGLYGPCLIPVRLLRYW